jgi:hypothetical protein
MYLNYTYLVTGISQARPSFEGTAWNPELLELRKMYEGNCIGDTAHLYSFQPSITYAQYDLAVLVSIPDIDETMTVSLASLDKSMYSSVASRELATLSSDYPMENIFYADRSMIDDVAGFAVHNRIYETEHQLAKPSSVVSAEIFAIRMVLKHIQICPRGRYLIWLDSLSSLMAMRSRTITWLIIGFMIANRSTGTFSSSTMM